ncbi:hypothetical protein [Streptomyces sp. NPDC021020]|uniref:hypothetical protein n=1 Tax=Streptomyces sp. NPDC021020 TaxID=3365109 RepID=UPI00378B6649
MNGKAAPAVLALCALAVAGTVTACGGKKDDAAAPSATKTATHAAPTTTPPATPAANSTLDEQQLKELIVGHGDIGNVVIDPVDPGHFGSGIGLGQHLGQARIHAKPAACQPLQDLTGFDSAYEPHAFVEQNITNQFLIDAKVVVTEGLASYEGDDAHKFMADLTTALHACKSFTAEDKVSYGHLKDVSSPDFGDEAVTYRITETIQDHGHPTPFPVVFTAVRVGRTIAAFYTPTPATSEFDPVHDAIKPQAEKLMLPAS